MHQPNAQLSVDVSAFFNRYDHLESLESQPGSLSSQAPAPARFVIPIVFGNSAVWLDGRRRGLRESENDGSLDVERGVLIFRDASAYTNRRVRTPSSVTEYEGSSPQHQAQLRSHVDLSHGLSWDASAYFVSALPHSGKSFPYTRVDTQLNMKSLGTRGN